MIPKPKHDIYLKTGEDYYVKIAWLHEFKDFELMIGFYALNGGSPSFSYQYPDRFLTLEELKNFKIPHKGAINKGNLPTCHFTFHSDKKNKPGTFHMRQKGKKPSNQISFLGNVNRDTGIVLDFFILTDLIKKYKKSETVPDVTDIVFEVFDNTSMGIRCRYSGINFDMDEVIKGEVQALGLDSIDVIGYIDRMLKCYITCHPSELNEPAIEGKNTGTYFLVSFPIKPDLYLVRSFIFN